MTACIECNKEIDYGEKDSPETWSNEVHFRVDIPRSAIPMGFDHVFCSIKCLMSHLVRVYVR